MASSGDDLGSYEQSPRVLASGTSRTNARPVAGPSKPPSKRKKAATPGIVEVADHTVDVTVPIAISSDEEDSRATKRGKAATATTIGSNGRAVSSRGKLKATAAAKRKKMNDMDEADTVEGTPAEIEDTSSFRHEKVRQAVLDNTGKGKSNDSLRKQNERLRKQLEDVLSQRDSLSSQLEELFQLRHTEVESQLVEQKSQYEAILKAKEDTVQELQSALSRVDKLSQSGATTSLHFLTRETADEEKLDVQREVGKLKDSLKKKDETIRAKDVELQGLNENIKTLRADLKAEIELNTKSASRNQPSSATKHPSKSSDAKNALAIRLYEDLTNLLVTNVKHEPGTFREDDAIYTCVQTTSSGKSLNFSLRFFKEAEGETPSGANKNARTIDKVVYTPLLLEKETSEFVAQLDFLAGPFTFQKEQMGVFTKTLMTYLEGEAEDSQNDTDQMEVEDD